jgi:hypothetical protein
MSWRAHRISTAIVLVAACGSSPPPVAHAPPPPERPDFIAAVTRGHEVATETPIVEDVEADGTMDLRWGGTRATHHDAQRAFARDVPIAPFVAAEPFGDAWIFVTNDGVVYRAPSYLGDLERVGAVGEHLSSELVAENVVVVRTATAHVFLIGADGTPRAPTSPGDGALVDAGFASATHGVIILAGGGALVTTDGSTYRPVALGSDAALEAWPRDGALYVRTRAGALRVSDDGTTAPASDASPRALSTDDGGDVTTDLFATFPAMFQAVPDAHGDSFIGTLFVGADGVHRVTLPEDVDDHCDVIAWGAGFLGICGSGFTDRTIIATEDTTTWRTVASVTQIFRGMMGGGAAIGRDGVALAMAGICADDPRPDAGDDDRFMCWVGTSGVRTHSLAPGENIVAVSGDVALVSQHRALALRTFGGTDATPITMPEGTPVAAGITADHTLYAVLFGDDGLTLALGPLDGALTARPLPSDTTSVSMLDHERGFATGAHFGTAFETFDAGASWASVTSNAVGDLSSVGLTEDDRADCSFVSCRGAGLVWGPRDVVTRVAHPDRLRLLAPATNPSTDVEAEVSFGLGSYVCDAAGTASEVWDGHTTRTAGVGWARTTDDTAEGSTHTTYTVRWGGADARGAFEGRRFRGEVAGLEFGSCFSPVALTRTTATMLVHECSGPADSAQLVSLGARATVIEPPGHEDGEVSGIWPFDADAVALWMTERRYGEGPIDHVVVVRGAQRQGSRDFAWPTSECRRYLSLRGGVIGVTASCPGDAAWSFHGLDGAAPRSVTLPTSAPALCTGTPSADRLLFTHGIGVNLSGNDAGDDGESDGAGYLPWATLDLDASGGWCVRHVGGAPLVLGAAGAISLDATNGSLAGSLIGPGSTRALTCHTRTYGDEGEGEE